MGAAQSAIPDHGGGRQLEIALPEAKRLLTIFSNKLAGRVTGTATLYIPDPTDASGSARWSRN